jgi:ornithine cyclodeaminase
MKIITLDQIKSVLPNIDLIPEIEAGFVAYSEGQAVVPPVGELLLDKGEVHIKYGYLKQDLYYVIKIASGFYDNPKLGLPSSNGLMLAFNQNTGEPVAILLDEGHLTDIRTAVAGAIAAKHLAPKNVHHIGIIGTGTQATMQLQHLAAVTDCRDVLVWGLNDDLVADYIQRFENSDFRIQQAKTTAEIMQQCNLIVTTTPATAPLVNVADLQPGTHITAVGSDTPHKQELDAAILGKADVVVADSISQCLQRGEIFQALKAGIITEDQLIELGKVIAGKSTGRTDDQQITVADLTGVAVQDIKIASAVYNALASST